MREDAKAFPAIHLHLRKVFIMSKNISKRRGQGLVEYIIIVASVALISLAALSMFGHKVADQYAVGAGLLPGAHAGDNNPIATGFFAGINESATDGNTANGQVSWNDITGNSEAGELVNNVVVKSSNSGDAFVAGE